MNEANNVIADEIFRVEKIEWQQQPAVKKSAKASTPQKRINRIKNDLYGMEFFAKMGQDNPNLNLYVPTVYETGDKYYIREFVADEPVVSEGATLDQASQRLEKLVQLLASIDSIEPYGEVRFVGSSNYERMQPSIAEWADENLRDGIINQAETHRVKEISADLGQYITPRIAHGDMSPYKHAYLRPDGKITLIDFENFTPQAARYFDVAWSYTRLYSFSSTTDIPKRFLSMFLEQAATAEHQAQQLMAVIIQRTLGMQKDSYVDLKGKDIDYRLRAKELLHLVLENRLELLYK
jgi:aminoglycoside phosphotransferase (APT) family kinase protein